jgi:hypothetical protein
VFEVQGLERRLILVDSCSMNRLNSSKNIDVGSSSFVSIRDARRMGLLELASR